jgi:hypothetical protein
MVKEVGRLLEDHGIKITGLIMGGKHPRLLVASGAKTAEVVVARSPSDHRTYRNIVKFAIRSLREAP